MAFKDGVARPFVKYIDWMGGLHAFHSSYRHSQNFLEGSSGEEPKIVQHPPGATHTAAPSQPPLTTRPRGSTVTSRRSAHTLGQGGGKNPKKRPIVDSKSSDEEEDVDMTIEDNSDSGSSVDSDKLPVKRLRTSTIVTRGSRAIDTDTDAAIDTDTDGLVDVDTDALIDTDTDALIDTDTDALVDTDTDALIDTDVDINTNTDAAAEAVINTNADANANAKTVIDTGAKAGISADVEAATENDTEPFPESPDLLLNDEPIIPDFLTAKSNVYSYLVSVNEPGFATLLDNYIAFELADHSGHRGNFPTGSRPKGIGWWTSRTRPDRIPPFDSLASFSKGIIEWWIAIQPDWRRHLKCGETLRGEGFWDRLYQPGINGLLNVIILVYWWAKICEERSEPVNAAYHWLVADITWVLSQLTRIAHEGYSPN